jgi:hypothetical protein
MGVGKNSSGGSETPSGRTFTGGLRPMDKRSNRQMIAERVQNDIKENNGIFPEKNTFIERK